MGVEVLSTLIGYKWVLLKQEFSFYIRRTYLNI